MVYVRPEWAQSVVPGVRGSLAICNAREDIVRREDERGCCGGRLAKIRVVDGEMRAIVRRLQKAVTVARCSTILCPTFGALIGMLPLYHSSRTGPVAELPQERRRVPS
jgi:hypothetical protein